VATASRLGEGAVNENPVDPYGIDGRVKLAEPFRARHELLGSECYSLRAQQPRLGGTYHLCTSKPRELARLWTGTQSC